MSNVSSVDLDELIKARELLNQEIGVENDPNMYKDYNPNREEEPKKNSEPEVIQEPVSESLNNNEEIITSENNDDDFSDEKSDIEELENHLPSKSDVLDILLDDSESNEIENRSSFDESTSELEENSVEHNASSEANLGKFDMFAAFEVKENANPKSSNNELEKIINKETAIERTTNIENIEKELELDSIGEDVSEPVKTSEDRVFESIDNFEEIDNILSSILDELDEDNEVLSSTAENEVSEISEIDNSTISGVDTEPNFEDETKEKTIDSENNESSLVNRFNNSEEDDLNPFEDEPEPYKKDVLSALMNRDSTREEYISDAIVEKDDIVSQETESSDMDFNMENFEINVDSNVDLNLQNAIDEPDEESVTTIEETKENLEETTEDVESEKNEDKFDAFEINVDVPNVQDLEKEETFIDSEELQKPENAEIEVQESSETEKFQEETEDIKEEKQEEKLDIGIEDIGRILGINEDEKPKKEEFVETTEYFDPTKARVPNKVSLENSSFEEPEIITDYNQLKEILQRELKESELAEQEKIEEEVIKEVKEEDINKYPLIEEFKFINEIATDEFKSSNKFSYIMGKNEGGGTVYGNFREHHNLAVFSRNDIVTKSFLNSLILSLCLKNNNYDLNFVLIDSDINSSFEVYNKSSYLYFNRIAKTNKEILDTLIEITKELDLRYERIAASGMNGIDQFNEMTAETQTTPMPNLIIVFNNYTDVSQATYADKINACLYQILKFGRIVGIYMVLTAMIPIEISQVNYNLSSRLSFKSDQNSKYTVGVEDVKKLPDEADAIYFNISKNTTEHIKVPTITDSELDLIIKELED